MSATLAVRGVLTGLRIDPPAGRGPFELDWIHVRNPEGKNVQWGFGASVGKSRRTKTAR